jgi:hypothetical protein
MLSEMNHFCVTVHRRTRQGGQLPPPPPPPNFGKRWKFNKIWADLSENMLKSGYFITILHKNPGKLSTATVENISPILLCQCVSCLPGPQ